MPPKKKPVEEEKPIIIGRLSTNLKCGIVETGTMMQVQSIRVPDFEIAGMDYIRLGDNSKYEDFIKRIIAIWTEYEKK